MATTNITPQPSVKVPWIDEGGRIALVWLNWLRSQLGQVLQPTNLGPSPSPTSPGVTGTLQPTNGGTGATGVPTNGQIPIGNGSVYVPATLTAGAGISVTNGAGSATIASLYAQIFAVEVTLTNAQILALPTTGITILATLGAPVFTKVLATTYIADTTAGIYTNLDASYVDLHLLVSPYYSSYGPVNDSTTTPVMAGMTSLLGMAAHTIFEVGAPSQSAVGTGTAYVQNVTPTLSTAANQAVVLHADNNGSGNFTGGHAANTLKVYVLYQGIAV